MHIRDAYGHKVMVVLTNQKNLIGKVTDYENPLETDTGNYNMELETDLGTYSFDETEIKEIRIIS
ncbi:hypothetical protein CM54_03480 [Staphylococcus sp. TE8]|uniref:hypothetical protein n=1 Tax=Staphylococcus sp. TE8 TaxID=1472720 RepID=UPI00049EA1DC|nr:hypothetical protein [Staphylococcus sp. TE8]KDE96106.1 hypothetical protein CM54_03480 [Staphylococcus sp. TE8]